MMSNITTSGTGRILVTHNDLDGVGCAVVYNKCFPGIINNFIDYRAVNNLLGQLISKDKSTPIMISDMSTNSEEIARALDSRGNVELIDHHPSAGWLAENYEWALVDTSKSATMLMFEVMSTRFNLEDLKPFVELVNDYDTWGGGKGPSDEAKNLNRLLGILGLPRFFNRFVKNTSIKLDKNEKLLLELEGEKMDTYIKAVVASTSVSKDAQGNNYAMIAVDRYTSEACHNVLKSYPEVEYIMAIDFVNNKVSLRGRGNIHLGDMAKSVGGGGHRQAAGFPIQHGAQIRMVLACQGKCPVTDRLEAIINANKRPQ